MFFDDPARPLTIFQNWGALLFWLLLSPSSSRCRRSNIAFFVWFFLMSFLMVGTDHPYNFWVLKSVKISTRITDNGRTRRRWKIRVIWKIVGNLAGPVAEATVLPTYSTSRKETRQFGNKFPAASPFRPNDRTAILSYYRGLVEPANQKIYVIFKILESTFFFFFFFFCRGGWGEYQI